MPHNDMIRPESTRYSLALNFPDCIEIFPRTQNETKKREFAPKPRAANRG
jgi:hypothetical protein